MTMDSTSGSKLWRLRLRFFFSISTEWHSRRCCRVSPPLTFFFGAGSRLHHANTISPPSLPRGGTSYGGGTVSLAYVCVDGRGRQRSQAVTPCRLGALNQSPVRDAGA
jgi:hypothetical protein